VRTGIQIPGYPLAVEKLVAKTASIAQVEECEPREGS